LTDLFTAFSYSVCIATIPTAEGNTTAINQSNFRVTVETNEKIHAAYITMIIILTIFFTLILTGIYRERISACWGECTCSTQQGQPEQQPAVYC